MAVPYVQGHQIIDLRNDANYYFEVAPQGDGQSRGVIVEVLDNGAPADLSGATNAVIQGKNAGGYNIFNTCSFVSGHNNYIDIAFTNGILDYAGVGKYVVTIYDGTTYVTSFPFNIVVTDVPYDLDRVLGSDSYEALNRAIATALSANRWWVEEGAPQNPDTLGASLGDYYMDAITGDMYYATASSDPDIVQWNQLMNSDHNRQITLQQSDFRNTYRFYGNCAAYASSLTISADNLSTEVFNTADAESSAYEYHVSIKSTNPNLSIKKNPTVIIGNGSVSVTLQFNPKPAAAAKVCVEIIKRETSL